MKLNNLFRSYLEKVNRSTIRVCYFMVLAYLVENYVVQQIVAIKETKIALCH